MHTKVLPAHTIPAIHRAVSNDGADLVARQKPDSTENVSIPEVKIINLSEHFVVAPICDAQTVFVFL